MSMKALFGLALVMAVCHSVSGKRLTISGRVQCSYMPDDPVKQLVTVRLMERDTFLDDHMGEITFDYRKPFSISGNQIFEFGDFEVYLRVHHYCGSKNYDRGIWQDFNRLKPISGIWAASSSIENVLIDLD